MLISGKMSVGVRSRTTGVSRTMTSAITIKVYGRCSAKRTIHILVFEFLQPGKTRVPDLPMAAPQILLLRPHFGAFGYERAVLSLYDTLSGQQQKKRHTGSL